MPDRSYPPAPEALRVPLYDDHTHIDPFSGAGWFEPGEQGLALDWREQLDRASVAGVQGVVQVGTDVESSRWSAEHAAIDPRMLAAVAIHPNDAARMAAGELDEALAVIDALAVQPRVRAIGETGLDFYRTAEGGRDAQLRSFEAHIDIAKRHGLALQIHDRDAHVEVVDALLRVGAPERTVFHCFSGDAGLARLATAHGWYLSFAGTVTFKTADALRAALKVTPRSRLLLETDAPYLAPTPVRGRPNAPYLLPHTLRHVAQVLETDPSMLAAQVASNTELVYGGWHQDAPTRIGR